MGSSFQFARNSFDLVRLGAALQVASGHAIGHLGVPVAPGLLRLLEAFPGVPIFFFTSGYLISRSYERQNSNADFAVNRVLRIYPALWVCWMVSIALVALTKVAVFSSASLGSFAVWAASQLSFVQFHNPDFLRSYGVGVLNGSLWTIAVELQFYVITPFVYLLLRRVERGRSHLLLAALIVIFALVNYEYRAAAEGKAESLALKLLGVSFVPWVYMFFVGILFQRNAEGLWTLIVRRYSAVTFVAGVFIIAGVLVLHLDVGGNRLGPVSFACLAVLTFFGAYRLPVLAARVLRGNDISYGYYIYHMPVINALIEEGVTGTWAAALLALAATGMVAYLSWRCVERPALALKRNPLRVVHATPGGR